MPVNINSSKLKYKDPTTGEYTAVNAVGGEVQDVQVNGTSILENGVANIPKGSGANLGVVRSNNSFGIYINVDGVLQTLKASENEIKEGTHGYNLIVPQRQHMSTFYGLAKAAGVDMASSSNPVGTYTDEAKVAIQKMLGIYEAPWELIREDTFTNETEADHNITVDANGEAFELTDAILMFETPKQNTEAKKGTYGAFALNDGTYDIAVVYCGAWAQAANSTAHGAFVIAENRNGLLFITAKVQQTSTNMANLQMNYGASFSDSNVSNSIKFGNYVIRKLRISTVTGTGHYKLYGKRKWQ